MPIEVPFQEINLSAFVNQEIVLQIQIDSKTFSIFCEGRSYCNLPSTEESTKIFQLLAENISHFETTAREYRDPNLKGNICDIQITTKKAEQYNTLKITYGDRSSSLPEELCDLFKTALNWIHEYNSKLLSS